jgi:hypothetical protein
MALITYTGHLIPIGINRTESDGLFAVTVWSIVGVAVTALTIWLSLDGPIEPLIGLG